MPFCLVCCPIGSTLILCICFIRLTRDGLQREVYLDFQPIFKYQLFKLFFQLTHNTQILPMPPVMSKICSCFCLNAIWSGARISTLCLITLTEPPSTWIKVLSSWLTSSLICSHISTSESHFLLTLICRSSEQAASWPRASLEKQPAESSYFKANYEESAAQSMNWLVCLH